MKIDCQGNEIADDAPQCCLHPTGTGTSHGWGGADDMRCCNCGVLYRKRWHINHERIDGHGPHATRQVKVYDE